MHVDFQEDQEEAQIQRDFYMDQFEDMETGFNPSYIKHHLVKPMK